MRNVGRRFAIASGLAALLLVASAATAQSTYSMTGKYLDQNNLSLMAPVHGDTPCPELVWGTNRPLVSMPGATAMTPLPNQQMFGAPRPPHNNGGCIPGAALLMTPGMGTAAMVGGMFTVPVDFFFQPPPGMLVATPLRTLQSIVQLASSFQFSGPPAASTRLFPIGATMGMTKAYAPWRVFQAGAWMNQTGRAGPTFTWCPGGGGMGIGGVPGTGCVSPTAGAQPLLVKNIAGTASPGGFGGTMSIVYRSGSTAGSFAQRLAVGPFSMALAIAALEPCLGLAPMCARAAQSLGAGRGYAAYQMQTAVIGNIFSMYKLTTMFPPTSALIKAVSGANIGVGASAYQTSKNFPWTTGHVIVRQTGMTPQGMNNAGTLSAMGGDAVTPMGVRNIQLVAGKLTSAVVGGALVFNYATIGQQRLSLPEPAGAVPLLAGVAGLLAIAGWRGRRLPS